MVEVGHFILNPLRKRRVCFLKERPVIVVAERRQPEEIDEEPCHFVAVLHNKCIEFHLSIREGIVWAKVDKELLDE